MPKLWGGAMSWYNQLPKSIAFVDVETTGLRDDDRVVSIGAVWIAAASLSAAPLFPFSYLHLIFNPGRPSQPRAERVHGFSDRLLKHQSPFATYAEAVRAFLSSADLVVAHNVEFDLGFINSELRRANLQPLSTPSFCTMQASRRQHVTAALDDVCARLHLARSGKHHGALEDAWLAMQIYLCMHGCKTPAPFSDCGQFIEPFNLRPVFGAEMVEERSGSDTGRGMAQTTAEAERIDRLVETVKQLKRERNYQKAETVLLEELDRQESTAATARCGVAPWYYEQLAIVYSKQDRRGEELAVLERYARQPHAPGARPAQLLARLQKVRAKLQHTEVESA